MDQIVRDFMAAVCGPDAYYGACERTVVQQLSTMPGKTFHVSRSLSHILLAIHYYLFTTIYPLLSIHYYLYYIYRASALAYVDDLHCLRQHYILSLLYV